MAALTVLIYHLTRSDNDATLPQFFLRGYLGVDLFFMLSGFVLTHTYLAAFQVENLLAVGCRLPPGPARSYLSGEFLRRCGIARGRQCDERIAANIVCALVFAFELIPIDGVIIALFPLLLLAAVSNNGIAARLLNTAPLRLPGDISYSLYLEQTFAFSDALALSRTPLGAELGLGELRLLTVVFALGMGFLIHRCIEKRCRSLLRNLPTPAPWLSWSR